MTFGDLHDDGDDFRQAAPADQALDWPRMANDFGFRITTTRFDEDYRPSTSSRVTTNFANPARGEGRQQNLRRALTMIRNRFNDLADWDNPGGDRYGLELD